MREAHLEPRLIAAEPFEELRTATIDDVAGTIDLISPLEDQGILVQCSRERLETEVGQFQVLERDGLVVACAALYSYPDSDVGKLGCFVLHPD